MKISETQSELLDQFLNVLSSDPHAAAPVDLNTESAQFARALRLSQVTTSAPGVKARIWQEVLAAASHESIQRKDREYMTTLRIPQSRLNGTAKAFSYVTALVAMIGLIIVLGASFNTSNGSRFSRISLATTIATLTPTPPVPLKIGTTITGNLTANSPQLRYQIKADETGLLKVAAYSEAFRVRLTYIFVNPVQVDPSDALSTTNTATHKEITMLAHVSAGAELTLTVSSELGQDIGQFSLTTTFGKVTMLELGKSFESRITPGPDNAPDLQYFAFDAKAGFLIDVRVESDENQDLTLFMQPDLHSANTANGAISFVTDSTPGCIRTYSLQCFDDDSGPGSDPELHHVLIRQDGRYELIVAPTVMFNLANHYKIVVSNRSPTSLSQGGRDFTTLSWKDPAVPFVFQGVAGKPIKFRVERLGGDTSFIRLTIAQGDVVLSTYMFTTNQSSTVQSVIPNAYGPVLLFVEYGQPVNDGAVTPFSVGQLTD